MRPPLSYVPLLPWAILLVALIVGLKSVGILDPRTPALSSGKATYNGVVTEILSHPDSYGITAELTDSTGHKFKARLAINSSTLSLKYSDSISIYTRLTYPKIDYSSPEPFDYPGYLRNRGITAVGYVSSSNITITHRSNSIYTGLRDIQTKCVTLLKRSRLKDESANFLSTALMGDDSALSDDARQTFSSAGQAHILALSGMHVGIVTLSIIALLFPLTLLRLRSARLIFTIILLWIYAALTGFSPSVVRAVIMASCLSGGYILQRHHVSLNSLLLAGILILAVSPMQLFDVGFQMSFVSVGCILLFMPFIRKVAVRGNTILNFILSATAMSIFATLGVGILTANYFHTFPVYFIPANIPIALLLPPLMCGGILFLILESLGFSPEWLIKVIDFIYGIVYNYADWISTLPGATIRNIYVSPYFIPCYYLCVGLLALSLWIKKRLAWGVFTATVTATIILPYLLKQEIPEYECFIPYDSRHISMIYYDGEQAHLIAMANGQIASEIAQRSKVRHRNYLGRRGLDSLKIAEESMSLPGLRRLQNMVELHGTKYLFITSDTFLTERFTTVGAVNYAVACNGFKGNVIDIVKKFNPDTILLSSNLHIKRHDRYVDSLQLHGVPFRSLRRTAHHITSPKLRDIGTY